MVMFLLLYLFSACFVSLMVYLFFFFKQKTAYEMRISDWSSDVCSSDLALRAAQHLDALDVEDLGAAEEGGADIDLVVEDAGRRNRVEVELGGRDAADRELRLALVAEHRDAKIGGLPGDLGAAVDPGSFELRAAEGGHRDRHVLERSEEHTSE